MILVMHLNGGLLTPDERFQVMTGFKEEEHTAFCARLLAERPQLWERVAVVHSDDLDYAYRHTNTVDQQWFLPYVCADKVDYLGKEAGCRSTSVGDLLVTRDGHFHLVSSFGFTDLRGRDPDVDAAGEMLAAHWRAEAARAAGG